MHESAPRINGSSGFATPDMIDFNTYNGEVPISPNTMPSVTRAPAKLNLEI